ncbi:hypothetical protein GCM10028796_46850 [Ramlibacter monticola]|uniref:Portal protein n=1 Tax=Ramlibacter monticola TaxID=1926872 RepID=A0A936Z3F0_9BURK|nr:hypothetical protein [Ramlibacter monticola]MBL0394310.1 hypothetical protein [Ramlibacter monticola]
MADTTDVIEEEGSEAQTAAPKKPGDKGIAQSARLARKWATELNASKKWMDRFTRNARRCEQAYLSQGDDAFSTSMAGDYNGKTNLFWSNVQVVLSAIYGRLPKATVERRFKDHMDDVSRVASLMMQRILNGDLERDWDDTNAAMRDAVQDRFVVGLGQVWCRYEVDIEEVEEPVLDPATQQPQLDPATQQPVMQKVEKIANEEATVDYCYWDDFRYSPCRRWRDCRWVARRVYMGENAIKTRFKLTPEQAKMIPMAARTPATDNLGNVEEDVLKATPFKQAAVWEIWEKESNSVCWYVEGCTFVLDYQADPLELDDFWPCPQPVVSTTLTKAFLPRADYAMAQDLYKELDLLNKKLSLLTKAVKAAGVYDKTAMPVKNLLSANVENELIPVENWSNFTERGGMKGSVDWMPVEAFVNAITQLNARKQLVQHDLYEVLGISDIMRGASVASETATAQTLKVQYGGARLSNLQNEVSRFVSEVMRIRANIISNHFQPQTIVQRSLIERTPDAQLAQPAVKLLKDFGTALYSINVTSESLAAPDWAQEKEARTEFLGAASNYLMSAAPLVQQAPEAGATLVQLLQWAAAGFKGAQTIEGILDQFARSLEAKAAQPPAPQPPSPEDQKNIAQAGKYGAEAERTKKETALIPPMALPAGGPGGGIQMTPGGPQPPQSQPAAGPGGGLPAGPGSVAPMQPQPPMPFNPMVQ